MRCNSERGACRTAFAYHSSCCAPYCSIGDGMYICLLVLSVWLSARPCEPGGCSSRWLYCCLSEKVQRAVRKAG